MRAAGPGVAAGASSGGWRLGVGVHQSIAVIGSGYVGTVVAACFGHVGHDVVAVEHDETRLALLEGGVPPYREPGLDQLLKEVVRSGRLRFTGDLSEAMGRSEVVFVCVGTPLGSDGRAEMGAMSAVADGLAGVLGKDHIVVTKSTVPVGTGRWLRGQIQAALDRQGAPQAFGIASNPEFLREGHAVQDFLHPDRIVIGSDDPETLRRVVALYQPIIEQRFPDQADHRPPPIPVVTSDLATSEMTKYASNAFLATKISFINELSHLCDATGADVTAVAAGMGLDGRIGRRYLDAGLGWGGSCLGKDLSSLVTTAVDHDYHPALLEAAMMVNEGQRAMVVEKLEAHLETVMGSRICVLGLAFKAGTDDVRDSPGLDIAHRLERAGAAVSAYDPMVRTLAPGSSIALAVDPYLAADGADAVVLATDWPELMGLDLRRLHAIMRGDLLIDGRNLLEPVRAREAAFRYVGVGRSATAFGI